MCWRWAACNGINLNQLGFLEDRIEELNAEGVKQKRQSVANRAKNVK